MKKFNDFCEKYEPALWQLVASLWFFIEYFCHRDVDSLFGAGVFWAAWGIIDIIRIKMKKK